MKRIAKFEKVSQSRLSEDMASIFGEEKNAVINLPKRATAGSAGYDFYSPFDFALSPKTSIRIPTGVRVKMEEG